MDVYVKYSVHLYVDLHTCISRSIISNTSMQFVSYAVQGIQNVFTI